MVSRLYLEKLQLCRLLKAVPGETQRSIHTGVPKYRCSLQPWQMQMQHSLVYLHVCVRFEVSQNRLDGGPLRKADTLHNCTCSSCLLTIDAWHLGRRKCIICWLRHRVSSVPVGAFCPLALPCCPASDHDADPCPHAD